MKETVVLSGKGGTGKTSIAASFVALAGKCAIADTDVDASNLPLLLEPSIRESETFRAGRLATIRQNDCLRCGACVAHCRFSAIRTDGGGAGEATFTIAPLACEGCGVCERFCPAHAIDLIETPTGALFLSETLYGPMVHARLDIGAENSGKLVSQVREHARKAATEAQLDRIIVDGPPGIGCPAIASLTGASSAIIVTEPTVSGIHDFQRVLKLIEHFGIRALVVTNKWDINPEQTHRIEAIARDAGADVLGRVRYDPDVTRAQIAAATMIDRHGPAAEDIRNLWAQAIQKGV